jgi:hypothetical protein
MYKVSTPALLLAVSYNVKVMRPRESVRVGAAATVPEARTIPMSRSLAAGVKLAEA